MIQHRDGRITWTTPTGHSYTSRPHDLTEPDDPAERLTDGRGFARYVLDRAARPSRSYPRPPLPTPPPAADPPPLTGTTAPDQVADLRE